MIHYNTFKKLFLFGLITLLFLSCEGKEGPAGPIGPAGNANVQIIDFYFNASELFFENYDTRVYFYSLNVQQLNTSEMAVLLYFRSLNSSWIQLPFSEPTWPLSINYFFYGQNLTLDIRTNEGNAKNILVQAFNNDTDFICKLVLIPSYLNREEVIKTIFEEN